MPSLTIDGKRAIIAQAEKILGEKKLLDWLHKRNIPSLRTLNEHVRKHKAKFFRELWTLSQKD